MPHSAQHKTCVRGACAVFAMQSSYSSRAHYMVYVYVAVYRSSVRRDDVSSGSGFSELTSTF